LRRRLAGLIVRKEYELEYGRLHWEMEYLRCLGSKDYEAFLARMETMKARRRIAILKRQGHHPLINAENLEHLLNDEFHVWMEEADRFRTRLQEAQCYTDILVTAYAGGKELLTRLLQAALLYHPELISPGEGWLEDLLETGPWDRALEAYHRGDRTELESLALGTGTSEELPVDTEILESEIRCLEERTSHYLNDLYNIYHEHPYKIRRNLSDPSWVRREYMRLDTQIQTWTRKQIELNRQLVESFPDFGS